MRLRPFGTPLDLPPRLLPPALPLLLGAVGTEMETEVEAATGGPARRNESVSLPSRG